MSQNTLEPFFLCYTWTTIEIQLVPLEVLVNIYKPSSFQDFLSFLKGIQSKSRIKTVGELGPLISRNGTTLFQSKVVLFARQSGSNCPNGQILSDNWNHLIGQLEPPCQESRVKCPLSGVQSQESRVKSQVSRVKSQESRVKSRVKSQESKIKSHES